MHHFFVFSASVGKYPLIIILIPKPWPNMNIRSYESQNAQPFPTENFDFCYLIFNIFVFEFNTPFASLKMVWFFVRKNSNKQIRRNIFVQFFVNI